MKVIDFFSGCGGASEGLRQAGLDIAIGLDFDKKAAETYQANFPEAVFYNVDIRELDEKELAITFKEINQKNEPLLLVACAPCQPFSSQNKAKSEDDIRRTLLDETHRFINELKPDYIFIENVPGLQNIDKDKEGPYKRFIQFLNMQNYKFIEFIAKSEEYGVPQRRKRFVLLASKIGQLEIPAKTHGEGLSPIATVKDFIGGFPVIKAGEIHPDDPWHRCPPLSERNLERIQYTLEGGDRRNWPEHLINKCHKTHSGHMDVYGRMSWDKPAPTLTTRCYSYSNGRFGHPDINQHRAISVREASRLQTFPMHFKFKGSIAEASRQIGNAVPCEMAKQFGLAILQHCQKLK
ncbi:DNA cytosine methyltransferase [Acinetobacter baumannii]|uniref:DNA cytosine methyltransferase n=1 Tax=Acinetobacter baumannii TaxID=470 RepID=UPI0021BDE593|nr:DNA cytosine methyltransferase [Acinetobacter baumannii]MCT9461466.1 DNA cytosine methyltransferase [Acinetobacter baumannii]MDV4292778.1 DNA cytosine methyltransferase [Acinetobacter baumannii]